MQIVTDRAADFSQEQLEGLELTYAPLLITLSGKTYVSSVDIQPDEFYQLLTGTDDMPTTSLPSPGEFAELYRELAKKDPDILSIHLSSGLSGTYNAAEVAAEMVKDEANVTVVDTRTLSGAEGWQVEAAARAMQAGWPLKKILELAKKVSDATDTIYTLPELKWLIHGGRISHIKGLLANMLNIKPVIGVNKETGKYEQMGQARTLKRAMNTLVDKIAEKHVEGSKMRIQIMHAINPDGAAMLKEKIAARFDVNWLPTAPIAPVLGAHTGPGLVGCAYAAADSFPDIP